MYLCVCGGEEVRMKYFLSEFLETFSFGRREKNRQLRLPRFTPAGRFIFIYETWGVGNFINVGSFVSGEFVVWDRSAQKVSPCPQGTRIFIIRTKMSIGEVGGSCRCCVRNKEL